MWWHTLGRRGIAVGRGVWLFVVFLVRMRRIAVVDDMQSGVRGDPEFRES